MTAKPFARLRACAFAACSALALTVALTGCNMEAHEAIDTHPSSSMPVPTAANIPDSAAAKATLQKPAVPVPPPGDADMGMPVYPNATMDVDQTGMSIKFEKSAGMALARLQTPDSVDSVIAFYKAKLVQTDSHGQATPSTPSEEKQDGKRKVVLVGNDAEGNIQMVEAREEEGKTAIELMTTQTKSVLASIPGANKAEETSSPASLPATGPPSSSLPSSTGAASMPPASGRLP
jgi:hypothetical protein